MKLASWFSVALVLACNATSSIGNGTLDGGDDQSSNDQPDSDTPRSDGDGDGGTANQPRGTPECVASIVASETNDYALSTTFQFELTHVAPNVALTFDWSGVTADLLGAELDPKTDIDYVDISMVNDRGAAPRLAEDFMTLSAGAIDWFALDTMGTRTHVGTEDLQPQNTPPLPNDVLSIFDGVTFGGFPYLVSIASTSDAGRETRMFAPFILDWASENTTVVMTSHSTTLAYAANLSALTPAHVPPNEPQLTLDVTELTTDVYGRASPTDVYGLAFPTTLREVRISEHSAARSDLAENVMDLDAVADHVWRAPVDTAGVIDLSRLTDSDGQAFPGIDGAEHTWLLALYAHDLIPAPVFLTALEPCAVAQ